jgi:hypothetical protein
MANLLRDFQDALIVRSVVAHVMRVSTEFPTQKALKDYLQEHPGADARDHRVVKKEKKPSEKSVDFDLVKKNFSKTYGTVSGIGQAVEDLKDLGRKPDPKLIQVYRTKIMDKSETLVDGTKDYFKLLESSPNSPKRELAKAYKALESLKEAIKKSKDEGPEEFSGRDVYNKSGDLHRALQDAQEKLTGVKNPAGVKVPSNKLYKHDVPDRDLSGPLFKR